MKPNNIYRESYINQDCNDCNNDCSCDNCCSCFKCCIICGKEDDQLFDPAKYNIQSHRMEEDFIKHIDECPISDEFVTYFKFDRRTSTFLMTDYHQVKFGDKLSKEHLYKMFEELKKVDNYHYLR